MPVGLPNLNVCKDYAMEAREQLYWLIAYLELPDRAVYWAAAKDAYRDTVVASSSLMTLGYLTTRPLWLLLYWIGGRIWIIATFLAKHLLSGVYVSTIKGFHQAKWIWNKYLYWQMSLSRRALLMEGSLVLTAAMLYLLRKYIQKKKYYERSVSWYKTKKRGVVKVSFFLDYQLPSIRQSTGCRLLEMCLSISMHVVYLHPDDHNFQNIVGILPPRHQLFSIWASGFLILNTVSAVSLLQDQIKVGLPMWKHSESTF